MSRHRQVVHSRERSATSEVVGTVFTATLAIGTCALMVAGFVRAIVWVLP